LWTVIQALKYKRLFYEIGYLKEHTRSIYELFKGYKHFTIIC